MYMYTEHDAYRIRHEMFWETHTHTHTHTLAFKTTEGQYEHTCTRRRFPFDLSPRRQARECAVSVRQIGIECVCMIEDLNRANRHAGGLSRGTNVQEPCRIGAAAASRANLPLCLHL